MSVYPSPTTSETFNVKLPRDLENCVMDHSRSFKLDTTQKLGLYGFIFAVHSKYGRTLCHFRYITSNN